MPCDFMEPTNAGTLKAVALVRSLHPGFDSRLIAGPFEAGNGWAAAW